MIPNQPKFLANVPIISNIEGVWEEYENLGEIASGTFGKVIKAKQKFGNHQIRAIKQIQINPLSDEEENEVKKLKALTNDHIVDYYGNIIENNELYIIMQFCKGNLRDQMKGYARREQVFTAKHIVDIITQITSAMLKLAKANIMHLDLKPENILFLDENYYKLCDFGCSQIFQNVSKAYCSVRAKSGINSANADFGTPAYIAPEVQLQNHGQASNSCDTWALGVILYELIYNKHPIGLNKLKKVESSDFRKFIEGKIKIEFQPKENYPIDIVQLLLKAKAKDRIKWKDLKTYLIEKYGRYQSEFMNLQDAGKSQILLVVIFANIIITIEDNIQNNINQFWREHEDRLLQIKNLLIKLGYLQMLKFKEIFQYKMKYKLKPKTYAQFKFMQEDMKEEASNIKFVCQKEDGKMTGIEAQLRENLNKIREPAHQEKAKFESIEKISVFIEEVISVESLFCNGHLFKNTCKIFQIEEKSN